MSEGPQVKLHTAGLSPFMPARMLSTGHLYALCEATRAVQPSHERRKKRA